MTLRIGATTAGEDHAAPSSSTLEEMALLTERQRRQLQTNRRIPALLTGLMLLMMAGLSLFTVYLVGSIFTRLTPALRTDLEWKATGRAAEIARVADLGIVTENKREIADSFAHYAHDPDIIAIVVTTPNGHVLAEHGRAQGSVNELFRGPPGRVQEHAEHLVSWQVSQVEGEAVGRVAVVVSKERLEAGDQLRKKALIAGVGGCIGVLLLCLAVIRFWLAPLIRFSLAAFERLEQTTQTALEATRLKSEFLANMSHEIRTPMNGILGMTELLGATGLNRKQRRYADMLRRSASALLVLLNDILDLSKVEAGRLELRPERFQLVPLLDEVAELFAAEAHAKGVELLVRLDPDLPMDVECDRERLRQILSNFVGNAVKFTAHGEVVLRASRPSSAFARDSLAALRIEVTDSGIGISGADQKRLFQPFSQADGSLTRRHGGTGLGLAICRRLVELMDGEIGVESTLGSGATFWVELPIVAQGSVVTESTPNLPPVHVLVVDDNASSRTILEETLAAWGLSSESAQSAREALGLLEPSFQSRSFDVVIIDEQMPGTSGTQLAAWIRDRLGPSAPPIVMLTSLSGANECTDDQSANTTYLTKPVRRSELSSCLERLMGTSISQPTADDCAAYAPVVDGKLLLVEDNPINQEVIRELLLEQGYEFELCEDGTEALAELERQRFRLVLMDCQMPQLDGYETTRRLRARELGTGHRTPVIAITAHALSGDRDKALAAGMDDYLTKPVTRAALRETLRRWLDRSSTTRPPHAEAHFSLPPLEPSVGRSDAVIELLLDLLPGQVEDVRAAVLARDTDRVKKLAHKLKGSCTTTGLPRLAALAARIGADPAAAVDCVEQLNLEIARVRGPLESELASMKSELCAQ